MQINAADQVSRSIQSMNEVNRRVVDENQDLSSKLLNMSVQERVSDTQSESQIDFQA